MDGRRGGGWYRVGRGGRGGRSYNAYEGAGRSAVEGSERGYCGWRGSNTDDFGRDRGSGRHGGGRRRGPYDGRRQQPSSCYVEPSSSVVTPALAVVPAVEKLLEEFHRLHSIKDEIEKSPEAAGPEATSPSSKLALRYPPRPDLGSVGTKCLVRANHFLVEIADKDLYHYDVTIMPEVRRGIQKEVISQLIKQYKDFIFQGRCPAYDGGRSLFTAGALPFKTLDFTIIARKQEFKVAIKLVGRPDLHHLKEFLQRRSADGAQDVIQVLDVVLRQTASKNYISIGRSLFSESFGTRDCIGEGLECWKGYFQSLRPTQMGLSLNIDMAAKVFYKDISVIQFAKEFLNINKDTSTPLPKMSEVERNKLSKAIKGLKVETTHHKGGRRTYRITDISSLPLRQLTFPLEDQGMRISVVDYFSERYGRKLKELSWPCLQSGSDKNNPIYLPMEVCKIIKGQSFSKKLSNQQISKNLRITCQGPRLRQDNIQKIIRDNDYNKDSHITEFGMAISEDLALVEARVLPTPHLLYHESGWERTCIPEMGQWNMKNKKMVDGGAVDFWTCINFSEARNDTVAWFCQNLIKTCTEFGMTFSNNPLINIQSRRPEQVVTALQEVKHQADRALAQKGIKGKQLQLLIIILPTVNDIYGKIKRICEIDLGIATQCCLQKHVCSNDKRIQQYLGNLALKINVKVGGTNNMLRAADVPLGEDPTIIFGADVTHPSPGDDSSPSIAAVVASMDWPQVTKYRSLISAQNCREEIIQNLYSETRDANNEAVGGMIREMLFAFEHAMNQKPKRIIFYRDGVSEGQFYKVFVNEIVAIKRACLSFGGNYLPAITFIVVQKRHHTRLFPIKEHAPGMVDKSGNIRPGTVVDRTICHPSEFDFYLCSHCGIQGTSRPTHYHVLWDENGFTADTLQKLTYNLCYTYARCTRSVSIVPPVYYAHQAAFRARHYIRTRPTDGGSTSERGERKATEVWELPNIKDNLKDVMFFC